MLALLGAADIWAVALAARRAGIQREDNEHDQDYFHTKLPLPMVMPQYTTLPHCRMRSRVAILRSAAVFETDDSLIISRHRQPPVYAVNSPTIGHPRSSPVAVTARAAGRSDALRLTEYFRPALRAHFGALDEKDLYLRFETHCRPEVLDAYVNGIDFCRSIVLGVFDDGLDLVGVAHLTPTGSKWELGLSVLDRARNRGVGTVLLHRAMQQLRLAKADRMTMHCLTENRALVHLVRKVGAVVVDCEGESDGSILVPATLPLEGLGALAEAQIAVFDFSLMAQRLMVRLWAQAAA